MQGVRGRALSQPRPLVLSGVRPGRTTHWLWVLEMRAWGPVTNPTARALASWLCALWEQHEGALGGRLLPGCWASGVGRSPTPNHSSFRACGRGRLPTGCGCGGCGRGDPSSTPHRTILRAGLARCGGGTRAPGGGASCLGVGRPATGALPPETSRPSGRAAGDHLPLAVGALCGHGGPAVLGTYSHAAVRSVLCALPGFAAPGGRCGLAPVLVPSLLRAACLSGQPRGSSLVRRASSGPVALGALVGFSVAVVPFPIPGAVAPAFTGWLRGARRGRPRTGLFVPAPGPCRGKGAGRAPRRTRSGPRDGVVAGGSLQLRSWAACAAVVWRVWTRSLTRPVSRTVGLSTGDSAGAPGLFRVDADTPPFWVGGRHARIQRVCGCVLLLAGAPHLFLLLSCPSSLFGPQRAGVARALGGQRTVRETGRVTDRVPTRQTTAAHAAQKPKPEGPTRDKPIVGPRTGTTRSEPSAHATAGVSSRQHEPGFWPASTCPAQPPSKAGGRAPGLGEGTTEKGKADQSTESDRTGRGEAHQSGAN